MPHTCYIVQAGKHLKIGYTSDLANRLETLQTGNALELVLIAEFPYDTELAARSYEKLLHSRFRNLRVRGEWFHAAPVLQQLAVPKPRKPRKEPREGSYMAEFWSAD